MQFEDFDNRIKEAADNHHPAWDEKAWDKMEALLDKHMPQPEKKRRRFFFFWLFAFLLLGGGAAWLLLEKPWINEQRATAVVTTGSEKNKDRVVTPGSTAASATESGTVTTPANNATTDTDNAASANPGGSSVMITTDAGKKIARPSGAELLSNQKQLVQPAGIGLNKDAEQLITTNSPGVGKKKKNTKATLVNDKAVVSANDPDKIADVALQKKEIPSINTTGDPATAVTGSKSVNNTVEPVTVSEEKKQEVNKPAEEKITVPVVPENNVVKEGAKKKKRANSFFFSLSAGPDVSAVGSSKIGKTRLLTGAGLGYTFNNRLTVRTGFYMTDKVYTAAPEDYKPKVPVPGAQYLTGIGADCKVYEVPVSFTYNFSRSQKQGIFAGAGISSLFMKKETYQYVYDYPGQPPYTYTKSYSNENRHLFSILTLSAGYQRKLNNFLSVAAEPYLKIPLTGVGHGNVKLSGGGVQFSLLVSPFAKNRTVTTGTK